MNNIRWLPIPTLMDHVSGGEKTKVVFVIFECDYI